MTFSKEDTSRRTLRLTEKEREERDIRDILECKWVELLDGALPTSALLAGCNFVRAEWEKDPFLLLDRECKILRWWDTPPSMTELREAVTEEGRGWYGETAPPKYTC